MKCQRVIGSKPDGADNQCPMSGRFRVSDPTDPWPLSYSCERCLPAVISALGGEVRVTILAPGETTAPARAPEGAPFRDHNRVIGQPKAGALT